MSERRRGLMAWALAGVLVEASEPILSGRVIKELELRAELNEHELSLNNSGQRRFETLARLFSGWATCPGFLDRSESGWLLKDEGRRVNAENLGPAWVTEPGRRHRAVAASGAPYDSPIYPPPGQGPRHAPLEQKGASAS